MSVAVNHSQYNGGLIAIQLISYEPTRRMHGYYRTNVRAFNRRPFNCRIYCFNLFMAVQELPNVTGKCNERKFSEYY